MPPGAILNLLCMPSIVSSSVLRYALIDDIEPNLSLKSNSSSYLDSGNIQINRFSSQET